MKWYKKVLLGVLSLVLLILLLNIGLNFWISRQLPQIINENNDSPYNISYKDLDIYLPDRYLKASEIIVVPKSSLNTKAGKPGIYAKIKSIEVNDFSLWDIIFNKKIHARSLVITNPEVTLLKTGEKAIENPKSIRSQVVEPFSKIIYVSDVFLNHGELKITALKNNKPILDISNISIKLEGILITDKTLSQKLPFSFRTYSLECDSLFYRPNAFYRMKARQVKTTNSGLKVSKFEMRPQYSRREFVKAVEKEKDLFNVSAKSISIDKVNWGFKEEHFFFHSGIITLDGVDADIYRGKMPPDDMKKKKLYNRLLRDIPFEMKVDTLLMKNSRLVYEEEKNFNEGPGILTFNRFNMYVMGLSSGFGKTRLPDVKINIKCLFMNSARLNLDWAFNVLDKSDGFHIKGRIFNFPAERLTPFTKPYMNAEVKGDLDEIYFNFTGNDTKNKGDFAINYDDLKVSIYKKKDRKKKNKFLSAIANLFVKNDTKDKVTNAEIDVERIPEKSFYNLLWRSIAEGLKKILL